MTVILMEDGLVLKSMGTPAECLANWSMYCNAFNLGLDPKDIIALIEVKQ